MNIGLVLSGGGVRGIAHIGVIKALEEMDIHPTHIAGTSAGAIVGALYASGIGWEEILDFFKSVEFFSFSNYAMNKPGLVDSTKFYDKLKEFLPYDSFEDLKKPLYITTTNLLEGTLKVFQSGELIWPLLASAAVPGIFTPIKINNQYYIDGGILNNFPVELLKKNCDRIVGVYVNPLGKEKIENLTHSYRILERAYHIKMANESSSKFEECDVLIHPKDIGDYKLFSVKNADAIFQLGYKAAKEALKNTDTLKIS
jgi:NTE family protein